MDIGRRIAATIGGAIVAGLAGLAVGVVLAVLVMHLFGWFPGLFIAFGVGGMATGGCGGALVGLSS